MRTTGKHRSARRGDGGATRQRLLAAGTDLFAERGFDGATVEGIARRARANKAMVSYHFGGKRKLYSEILASHFSRAEERLNEIGEARLPAEERLRAFVDLFARIAAERPTLPAMILREVLSGGRRIDESLLRHFLAIFSAVREIVAQGIREGSFRPVDPALAHLALIGSLVFFFATETFRARLFAAAEPPGEALSPEAFVRYVQDLTIHGLSANTGGAGRGGEK